jgi:hypothetical protein
METGGRSDKPVLELVGQSPAPRVESMREAVARQVRHTTRVDVGEAEQLPGEVGGVIVGAEQGPEVGVEHVSEAALHLLHLRFPVFYHLQQIVLVKGAVA